MSTKFLKAPNLKFTWVIFVILIIFNYLLAHITEGTGQAQQFYSYFTSNPPVINNCLTDRTTPEGDQGSYQAGDEGEWKDAYIRYLKFDPPSGTDTLEVTLFLMNDNNYLYVGFTGNSNNLSNNMNIDMCFDQGIGGGNHNDLLEGGSTSINNGEYRVRVSPDQNGNEMDEYSFDGTSWIRQNNGSELVMALGHNFGGSFVQAEFKIPINNNPAPDDNRSYLDVTGFQELGFHMIYYTQALGAFTWDFSNNDSLDPTNGIGWADLKLGVERSYVTFYSSYNANGNPLVDGNIFSGAVPDDAWRGAYSRNIVLTNFAGSIINAILYSVEDDDVADNFYVGMVVLDNEADDNDSMVIYQEQHNTATSGRDYLLENLGENALIADTNAYVTSSDRHFSSAGSGTWAADGDGTGQTATGRWYGTRYEYEFQVNRSGGAQDINIDDGSLMGFQLRYHDGSDGTEYYWEYSPNSDLTEIDMNNNIFVATGWPDLQLGAPYVQVVYPEDNAYIEGVTNVRIYAKKSTGIIDSAVFFRKSVPATRYPLTRIGSTDEWSGTWDVTVLPNGADTLVFKVYDGTLVMDRLVNVNIKNDSMVSNPPTVVLTSPAPGSEVSGTVSITFSHSAAAGRSIDSTLISIDGADYIATSAANSHDWNTANITDGSHTAQIRVVDDAGASSMTSLITYVINNAPTVAINAPAPDSTIRDTVQISFSESTIAALNSTLISIDGGTFVPTTTNSTHILATGPFEDGAHTIQIKVTDVQGREGFSSVLKINTFNSPTVSITSPAADSILKGTMAVLFNSTAISSAAITSAELSIDGGTFQSTQTLSNDTIATGSLTDGSHTLQIRVTDSNQKQGLSEIVKVEIRNAPTVEIDTALANDVVREIALIPFTITDSTAAITSREIRVDGGIWRATSAATVDSLNTLALEDGSHTVQVRVEDANGKTGLSQLVAVIVRNAPEVQMDPALADSVVSGTVVISFTVTDSSAAIAQRQIRIDGSAWRAASNSDHDSLNTLVLEEGSHIVQVKVTDADGRVGVSQTVKMEVKNAPEVEIDTLVADAVVRETVVIPFTVTYSTAVITSQTIRIDGGAWRSTSNADHDSLNTLGLEEGSHTIQVMVEDENGKTCLSQIVKVKVKNAPTVVIDTVIADSVLRGTNDITFTVTDSTAPIDIRQISIDGGALRDATTPSAYTLDTRPLTEGSHTARVRVVDVNGKTGYSQVLKFKVYNLPVVEIDTLFADSVVKGIVDVDFTVIDSTDAIVSREISVNGGAWQDISAAAAYTLDTRPLTDGSHNLQVRATDASGKTGYSQIMKIVVKNAPTVEIDTLLADSTVNNTILIRFVVLDSTDRIDIREITIDGNAWIATTTDSSHTLDTRNLKDGAHIVQVKVTDVNGKTDLSRPLKLNVDNTPPVITAASLHYPGELKAVAGSDEVLFSAAVFDQIVGLDISRIRLSISTLGVDTLLSDSGADGDSIHGDNVFSIRLKVDNLTDGSIGYAISASDILGNSKTIQDSFYYDNTVPDLTISVEPRAQHGDDSLHGNSYFQRVMLKGAYGDAESGIQRAWIRITDTLPGGKDLINSPMSLIPEDSLFCKPIELVEGDNYITVSLLDWADNRTDSIVYLNYIPPKITSKVGKDGGTVKTPNNTMVEIPEDALLTSVAIGITRLDTREMPAPEDKTIRLLSSAYDFGPDGTVFRKEVKLSLAYTHAELDIDMDGTPDINEGELTIYFLDGKQWVCAGNAAVDTALNLVSVYTNHFTVYAIGSKMSAPERLKSYWTHNPLVRSRQSTFIYDLPSKAKVSLHVYDLAGDLVRIIIPEKTEKATGSHQARWDGTNGHNRFAGTGLYIYLFKAEIKGKLDIVKKPIGIINR